MDNKIKIVAFMSILAILCVSYMYLMQEEPQKTSMTLFVDENNDTVSCMYYQDGTIVMTSDISECEIIE